eukprot:3940393-Rhodomonas_salina.1
MDQFQVVGWDLGSVGMGAMPKLAVQSRNDVGSMLGPLLFTLAFSLVSAYALATPCPLFPIIVGALVHEKVWEQISIVTLLTEESHCSPKGHTAEESYRDPPI